MILCFCNTRGEIMELKINLLIVDDEQIIREGLCSIDWRAHGICDVYVAGNGQEAYELLEKKEVHILISDVKMPVMDGIELGKRVFALNGSTRIIMLSGYSEFEYAKSALKFGAVDYLLKPVDEDELIATVKKAILQFEVDKVKELFSKKSERINELQVALDEADKNLLENYDGLLLHDKLFADDENIRKVSEGFSVQVLTAINYINKNYALNLNADIVADVVKRSKNYFSTQFKKELCVSLIEYINKVRIAHAKLLLKETGLLTYEIAERVGFSEYRYFCTVFKKSLGVTPSHYRDMK